MLTIRTNLTALRAGQSLARSQSAMQQAMLRLSTGLRINSAADDPAGSAIANRMTARINGMAQAQRNAADGISVVQTTEGALDQINDNVQQIRRLTVQALNGTNSRSDRASIQDEITQRLAEIDRLSDQTRFNGLSLLGRDHDVRIQVGANDGDTIAIHLSRTDTASLGLEGFDITGNAEADIEDVVNQLSTGDTVTLGNTVWTVQADGRFSDGDGHQLDSNEAAVKHIDEAAGSGQAVTVKHNGTSYQYDPATNQVSTGGNTVYLDQDNTLVTDSGRRTDPLTALDAALDKIDHSRSSLGAMQNRFESVIDGLGTSRINLAASRSRIEDADYAAEVSRLISASIRSQVGIAVLAQANQMPSMILSLLRQSFG